MGGSGSGYFGRRSRRRTTRDVQSIALYDDLIRGAFRDPDEGIGEITIALSPAAVQHIRLSCTPQPTSGVRWWMHCPKCERRCGKLHRPWGALEWACRVCQRLVYRSQRMSQEDRWRFRSYKLYDRAGCAPDDGFHYRPKGMHWRRFNALIDAAQAWEHAAFGLAVMPFLRRLGYTPDLAVPCS